MNEALTFPNSEIPFNPSPAFLLGPFDVYDREETLGAELDGYDPNEADQLNQLLERYAFPRWERNGFTAKHRTAFMAAVGAALSDSQHDFSRYLEADDDFCLPASWLIRDSRQFFFHAYTALCSRWGEAVLASDSSSSARERSRHGS